MKGTYDGAMDEANTLFNSEHKALQIAQRIQEQNEYGDHILAGHDSLTDTPIYNVNC